MPQEDLGVMGRTRIACAWHRQARQRTLVGGSGFDQRIPFVMKQGLRISCISCLGCGVTRRRQHLPAAAGTLQCKTLM
jgi:hypothetical protein